MVGGFTGVERVVGTGDAGDRIVGLDVANSWSLNTLGQILLSSITYEQFEIAQGGSAADTLTGPNNATQWNLSGPNSGNVTIGSATIQFTAIENLTSGAGNDTVIVEGGGSLSGTLNLGAGTDVLDLSDSFGALDVLNATNRSGSERLASLQLPNESLATATQILESLARTSPRPGRLTRLDESSSVLSSL